MHWVFSVQLVEHKDTEEVKASERHRFIVRYQEKYTVKKMCQVLKISESGYYRWLRNQGKQTGRQLLLVKIKEIVNEHPDNQNYGVDRILLALLQKGIQVSRRTVYRTMQEGGMLHKKRTPRGITKATTEVQEQENLIKRDFHADRPMQKLLTDISEIQCVDGELYVSPVLDCFSGEILALEMRDNMKKELCIDTVRQLQAQYGKLLQGVILHSDRGSQYTSEAFQEELRTLGIIQSLSGTGHCFDNARMESFFCYLEEGEDLPNRGIQAHQSTGQDHCFPIRFHLLQPHQSLFSEPRWFASCKIP